MVVWLLQVRSQKGTTVKLRSPTGKGVIEIHKSGFYPDVVLTAPVGYTPKVVRLTSRSIQICIVRPDRRRKKVKA